MRINNYQIPKSSFLSVEKDLSIITDWMLKNKRLKKLLYYTTPDAMDRPPISQEESIGLIHKNIKIVPKMTIDRDVLNYVIISFDNFLPNASNPQFRDNTISFDIVCHYDQWHLQDFQLRPYRIAAEIDTMFNEKHLTGIGTLKFFGATQIILNDEFIGISLTYEAIHGEEDKKGMLNPEDQKDFEIDFNELFDQ